MDYNGNNNNNNKSVRSLTHATKLMRRAPKKERREVRIGNEFP